MENLLTIGERVRLKRKEAGFTQDKLASLTGVSRQKVTQIESNYIKPDFDFLYNFIRVCRTSYEFVLEGMETDKVRDDVKAKPILGYSELIKLVKQIKTSGSESQLDELEEMVISILERNHTLNDKVVRLGEEREKMLHLFKSNK
ncbi:helix-turn-helix domain-containing protein [Fulvivirga sp. 29W222]|uniref:Helix-turn-helix domain-containing protein n=1 Tax=Fulvivirga marina TaxID=2494733 RepID=A0A937FT28_9BACT|nr:helix-turn-helix domain-containing protein [Fulvivirga marina]MBL6445030.1 helix-turn-helix domain-containing protein [Fulvivirga marina]